MAVYSKYIGVSGVLSWGLWRTASPGEASALGGLARGLIAYGAIVLMCVAGLFVLRVGDRLTGKSPRTGQIPTWSYVLLWPFHATNLVAIHLKRNLFRRHIEDATEIVPNLFIGGWFADRAARERGADGWRAILDLTTEFPQRAASVKYLNLATWDGNPPPAERIHEGAQFLVRNAAKGPTLCHCASGIGRSTTVLCAALVLGGHADDYQAALLLIQRKRPIVRLNAKMRRELGLWQRLHLRKAD